MDRIEEIRGKAKDWPTLIHDDIAFLLSHISSLEKRLEAQGKVVEKAKAFMKNPTAIIVNGDSSTTASKALEDALREVE